MAWRSKEMSANMSKGRKRYTGPTSQTSTQASGQTHDRVGSRVNVEETDTADVVPPDINKGVPFTKTLFDVEGVLNLSKVTGPEAVRYC